MANDLLSNPCDEDGWSKSPRIFYLSDGDRISSIAGNIASLAAKKNRDLDPLALVELSAIGFQLGTRTLFHSVQQLRPWERIDGEEGQLSLESQDFPGPPDSILDSISEQACEAFEDGAALELSGGLDSRLILASALSRGVKPKVSFSLGEEGEPDFDIASAIAHHFDFPHVGVPLVVDEHRLEKDTLDVLRAASYGVNAACYGWLPGTLAILDDIRAAQVSGGGGEVVGGFFYTPFDPIIEPLKMERLWIRNRLMLPWIQWRILWQPGIVKDLEEGLVRNVMRAIASTPGTWRERVDYLYTGNRVRRGAVAVFDASRVYYKVVAPYMSAAYFGWARSLPIEQRAGRRAQRALLRRAYAPLAEFSGPGKALAAPSAGKIVRKILRRVFKQSRAGSFGAVPTAEALTRNEMFNTMIQTMVSESDAGFSPEGVESVLKEPALHPELLGVLLTAAVAWYDRNEYMKNERNPLESEIAR